MYYCNSYCIPIIHMLQCNILRFRFRGTPSCKTHWVTLCSSLSQPGLLNIVSIKWKPSVCGIFSSLEVVSCINVMLSNANEVFSLLPVRILDISFNILRTIEGLDQLTQLKKLFLVNNKLSKIENLSNLQQLQMLELGSNRIRVGICFSLTFGNNPT